MHRLTWVVVVVVSTGCAIRLGTSGSKTKRAGATTPAARPATTAGQTAGRQEPSTGTTPAPAAGVPGQTVPSQKQDGKQTPAPDPVKDPKPDPRQNGHPPPRVQPIVVPHPSPFPTPLPAPKRTNGGESRAAAGVRAKLTRVRNDIPRYAAQLRPIQCGYAMQCYSVAEVQKLIARIRREVADVFPREALASRLSLDAEIEQVSRVIARSAGTANAIQLVRSESRTVSSSGNVDSGSVDALLRRVVAVIDRYLAHDVLNPTITINSAPDKATFKMRFGSTTKEATTNNKIVSVWRAHYNASVSKRGYRTSRDFPIDLMNDDRTTVECALVSNADTANDTLCWMK